MESKQHWEQVYQSKAANEVSWFQQQATQSLKTIETFGLLPNASIVDVGAGASSLCRDLLSRGYAMTVLDISAAALNMAKQQLAEVRHRVQFIEADVVTAQLPFGQYDLWHDRAVFHFLTTAAEREAYKKNLRHALKPKGYFVVATFAEDGPEKCSGLNVMRYSAQALQAEFSSDFELLHSLKEDHVTPNGGVQKFVYCCFRDLRND